MYWSVHSHSKYSTKDALPSPGQMVERVAQMGQPALALTDHGSMGGVVQLYKASRKAGIEPLPGMEAYVLFDRGWNANRRWHLGMVATSQAGYRNLVGLHNLAHQRYHYKPVLDLGEIAQLSQDGLLDGIAVTSGCHFGVLARLIEDHHPRSAENVLRALDRWFGSGCYVEIQHHDRPGHDEETVNETLLAIANAVGLPVVITQDSHYVHKCDQPVHDMMKRIVSWSDDVDDAVFPGSPYHLADDAWMRGHHQPRVYDAGIAGLADLLGKADVRIPEWDTFRVFIPDVPGVDEPDEQLRRMSLEGLQARIDAGQVPKSKRGIYLDRIDEELDILQHAGFASYVLFTRHLVMEAVRRGITVSARGSACGSLVCWLVGITPIDPIRWGVDFGRFLTKDRSKPPDIDIEIEDDRKPEMVQWITENWFAAQIGTWSSWTARGTGEEEDHARGSIVRDYKSMSFKRTGVYADPVGDDLRLVQALSAHQPLQAYGVHASGVLVCPETDVFALIPLMQVKSSATTVTSYEGEDLESIGLMKADLLGSKTLAAVRELQQSTGIDRWDIPLSDRPTYAMISRGDTHGCFQLEGKATRAGIRTLKPSNINDVIAAMALFRPAPMGSGATNDYIARKHGNAQMPSRHPVLSGPTERTYGVILYQEQMMDVLRGLGMSREPLNRLLKAVKASNQDVGGAGEVIAGYRDEITELCAQAGVPLGDTSWLLDQLMEFAGYSFNMAHATAYGLLAYQTAWWKTNYPVQFWTAMLSAYSSGGSTSKSHDSYLAAARKAGVRILKAHVNHSKEGYTAEEGGIRKGLVTIHGVGRPLAASIAAGAPYESVMGLVDKVKGISGGTKLRQGHSLEVAGGVMAELGRCGALAGLVNDIPPPKPKRSRKKDDSQQLELEGAGIVRDRS